MSSIVITGSVLPSESEPKQSRSCSRKSAAWKRYFTCDVGQEGKVFGLQDIFTRSSSHDSHASSCAPSDTFYTFRLEHREGDITSQFRGEERILLFRSDKPGAVAKIVYSSEVPDHVDHEFSSATNSSVKLRRLNSQSLASDYSTIHAKIHVLDVKPQYRGRDLGGLLFSEAMASLKSKYCSTSDEDTEESREPSSSERSTRKRVYDIECSLDAKEDSSRYGRLVRFYEYLGCRVKPSARVQYVNNNDSETFRKIPMVIHLQPSRVESPTRRKRASWHRNNFSSLVSAKGSFLPVKLIGSMGKLLVRSNSGHQELKLDWLVSDSPEGIQFYTTLGHILIANPNGSVSVLSQEDQNNESNSVLDNNIEMWSHFSLCHVFEHETCDSDSDAFKEVTHRDYAVNTRPDQSKDLWVMRSHHFTFLTANAIDHTLTCTNFPSFWQPDSENLSLLCTSDTPSRRHHYRTSWKLQTYEFVKFMRSRFLDFSLAKAKLSEALEWVHQFPANPFQSCSTDENLSDSSSRTGPSLRTLSFLMAETAREEGLPDWVQLVALFHELGEAVKVLDTETCALAESSYDWTISSRSRVVGCKVPQQASFSEFKYLNTDENNPKFNTDIGVYKPHCGLDNVLLTWSGCEYMYYLLKHNNVNLPDEALSMIRYFVLGDWHEHNEYSVLTSENDTDVLQFVSEFDALRRRVRSMCYDCIDLTDEECKNMWESHYAIIAAKYKCDHMLNW